MCETRADLECVRVGKSDVLSSSDSTTQGQSIKTYLIDINYRPISQVSKAFADWCLVNICILAKVDSKRIK